MSGIERDITGNNDFERVHNESFPFYEYKTEITPTNILNGPKNPVLTSNVERGSPKILVEQVTPTGTGTYFIDILIPKDKKYNLKALEATASWTGTVTECKFFVDDFSNSVGLANNTSFFSYVLPNSIVLDELIRVRCRFVVSAYTSGVLVFKALINEIVEAQ